MANKIRRNLRERLGVILEIVAAKEGVETTDTVVTSDTQFAVFYGIDDEMLTYDGRYVYRAWDDQYRRKLNHVVDHIPAKTFEAIFESIHDIKCQRRTKNDNEDFEYQFYLNHEDKETDMTNPVERMCYTKQSGNPETIVLEKMVPPDEHPDTGMQIGEVRFTRGGSRYDDETVHLMKKLLRNHIDSLPEEKQEQYVELFCGAFKQRELAEKEGISEAAISKRKKQIISAAAKMFQDNGYTVITKDEQKKEKELLNAYEEHFVKISRELRKLYFPKDKELEDDEDIDAEKVG